MRSECLKMYVVQVDVSNVRELNIPDNDADALDQMLDAAGGVINPDADADIMFDAEREAEVTRLAIKQKIAEAADVDAISRDLPPKLRIKPDDSEDVVSLLLTYLLVLFLTLIIRYLENRSLLILGLCSS